MVSGIYATAIRKIGKTVETFDSHGLIEGEAAMWSGEDEWETNLRKLIQRTGNRTGWWITVYQIKWNESNK